MDIRSFVSSPPPPKVRDVISYVQDHAYHAIMMDLSINGPRSSDTIRMIRKTVIDTWTPFPGKLRLTPIKMKM